VRIKPNKSNPHRDVAILLDKDTILLEDGTEMPYDCTFDDTKIFASQSVVRNIWNEGVGEIQSFDRRITKWRKKCPDHYKKRTWWPGTSLEVTVSDSKSFPINPKEAVEAYAYWRDWVEENGGNIKGSMSNTSLTLFKASLHGHTYETPYDTIEKIGSPLGGRLLPCKSLFTSFVGDFVQWDKYSAYTTELSRMSFGGIGSRWKEKDISQTCDTLVEKGYLIYVEAEVKIPDIELGPLPIRRDRKVATPMWDYLSFPRDTTLKGIWTYEEIRQADLVGCKIKIHRIIYHVATGKKYWHEDWYHVIISGRESLQGFAKSLAKQTGNSLWGRYAMRSRPSRTKWRDDNGNRQSEISNLGISKSRQCMELADQLCGKIRAALFELAISAGNNLIQGNTDGAWVKYESGWNPPDNDWRNKQRSSRIDIVDDRTYRYWEPGEENPVYITPGVDMDHQEKTFNRWWDRRENKPIVCLA